MCFALVVRFDVLTAMLLEIKDFCDVMFCQCLRGSPCLEGPCSPPVHCQTVKERMSCLTMQQKTLTVLWNTCNHLLNNTVLWSTISLFCTWTMQDLSNQQMQNLAARHQMQSLAFQQPIQGFDGQTQFYLHDQQQAHRRTWAQQAQYPTHQGQQDVRMLWGDPHSPR